MENLIEKPIGQIVAEDYRTAQIFKNHKIDFCCQGNRSIQDAAEKSKIDAQLVIDEINAVQQAEQEGTIDFKSWPLDLLADYIEKTHHRYVEEKISVLKPYLEKLCRVHGERHPELFEITEHFNKSAGELASHMKKEEIILFPAVRKMVQAKQTGIKLEKPHFGTVENPIQMMMMEHETEGERFRLIEKLSNNYTPPQDACNTYRVTFALLQEFENDLHRHIHLENNILFPKSAELEKELNGQV
ncbi:iron-sulfur cluster repair di-iron protein [Christiangramia forsetii]|uniref:Nitric oxide-dependent regulator n=2 Tax=Christiangramia forsetii TaxID=411153 RepID=A0M180_CHRFK|nr:iron-sulfur cluster repair di-iron protein [Christiangramia forsetii]GGG43146.1 iron-sulfur cluster repair di-iron protein [Christiangramia forsetii]CAL66375.1 nitric oxide-dependent regulator [Christiangramia forsetii KT0803]